MFFGCTVPPDNNETEPGSSNQYFSPSESKTAWIDLVPYRTGNCVPKVISSGVNISEIRGCHLFKKLLQRLVPHKLTVYLSIFNLFLTQ